MSLGNSPNSLKSTPLSTVYSAIDERGSAPAPSVPARHQRLCDLAANRTFVSEAVAIEERRVVRAAQRYKRRRNAERQAQPLLDEGRLADAHWPAQAQHEAAGRGIADPLCDRHHEQGLPNSHRNIHLLHDCELPGRIKYHHGTL